MAEKKNAPNADQEVKRARAYPDGPIVSGTADELANLRGYTGTTNGSGKGSAPDLGSVIGSKEDADQRRAEKAEAERTDRAKASPITTLNRDSTPSVKR